VSALTIALPAAGAAPVVLTVGADPDTLTLLVEQFGVDGFHALAARSAVHARALAVEHPPAVVVLGDLDEPRAAVALLAEIRDDAAPGSPWEPGVPVIMVSCRAQEIDVLRAFELGADDFVARPFAYLELRARLRAQLRRGERGTRRRLRSGPLEVDRQARIARLAGRRLDLSRLEFDLLTHLAAEPERVFTRDELLRAVWGFRSPGATRTLDSHASRLRRKLDRDGGCWITNVRGVGYRLRD
jgi:DNA-binding response OmpR family regulator